MVQLLREDKSDRGTRRVRGQSAVRRQGHHQSWVEGDCSWAKGEGIMQMAWRHRVSAQGTVEAGSAAGTVDQRNSKENFPLNFILEEKYRKI